MGRVFSFVILFFLGVNLPLLSHAEDLDFFTNPDQKLLDLAAARIDAVDLWTDTSVSVLKPSTDFNRKIPLKLVVIKRSTWSKEQTVSEIRRVEAIFSQCEFSFSPITIVQTSITSNPMYDVYGSDVNLMDDGVFKGRPLVFIDEKRPASMNPNNAGYANTKYWAKERISVNSAFVFNKGYEFNKLKLSPERDYSVLAHELAHLLFDERHNKEDQNLLCGSEVGCTGSEIAPEQCESISESFFL